MFAQCGAMYKTDGPEELKCVGETEFVQVRPLDGSFISPRALSRLTFGHVMRRA